MLTRRHLFAGTAALGLALGAPGAVAQNAGAVVYIDKDKVAAAFAKGMPLLETAQYKIHASRRAAPGQVEVHQIDTDIIYVLTGTATFVTGGTVQGGKTVEPNEIRGTDLAGGETRQLQPGDVVVVPHGTPHWFKAVPAPMTYYVVKAPTGAAR